MRPHNSFATVTTNATDRRARLGVDIASIPVLLDVLSTLYHHSGEAVLREYAANARDSHRVAGTSAPVDITLPTIWSPALVITDVGTGLCGDDLVDIFGTYGASTKRDSDTQTGMFGIGSKSAFSVSSQFTVSSVKDGLQNLVSLAIDEEGFPFPTFLITDRPTTDPTGLVVTIPVSEKIVTPDMAQKVFAYWPSGSVRIDGTLNVAVTDEALRINETLSLVKSSGSTKFHVVVDGIKYGMTEAQREMFNPAEKVLDSGWTLAITDAATTLIPHSSREVLRDCSYNDDWLQGVADDVVTALIGEAQPQIDAAPNAFEARALAQKLPLNVSSITYRNQAFSTLEKSTSSVVMTHRETTDEGTYKIVTNPSVFEKARNWRGNHPASDIVVIHGTHDEQVRARRILRRAMDTNTWSVVLFADTPTGTDGWFSWGTTEGYTILSYEDLKAMCAPRAKASPAARSSRPATMHLVIMPGDPGKQYVTVRANLDTISRIVSYYPDTAIVNQVSSYHHKSQSHRPLIVSPRVPSKALQEVVRSPRTSISTLDRQLASDVLDATGLAVKLRMSIARQVSKESLQKVNLTSFGLPQEWLDILNATPTAQQSWAWAEKVACYYGTFPDDLTWFRRAYPLLGHLNSSVPLPALLDYLAVMPVPQELTNPSHP